MAACVERIGDISTFRFQVVDAGSYNGPPAARPGKCAHSSYTLPTKSTARTTSSFRNFNDADLSGWKSPSKKKMPNWKSIFFLIFGLGEHP